MIPKTIAQYTTRDHMSFFGAASAAGAAISITSAFMCFLLFYYSGIVVKKGARVQRKILLAPRPLAGHNRNVAESFRDGV
jgi:hypothetical protein